MTRAATGMAIASSVVAMSSEPDCRPIERDIGGLLEAEYRSLIIYSRRLTGDGPEATDLVHIVCARVLSQPTPLAAVENLSGWLRTVLFRTFVDVRRRAKWEIPTESAALDRPTPIPDADGTAPVTIDDIRALLPAVPEHYRVPYEMFTFEHRPYAQIAALLGLSCVTVGTRINRARGRLRHLVRARYGV